MICGKTSIHLQAAILLSAVALLTGCDRRSVEQAHPAEITVAAAANLTQVLHEMEPRLAAETGVHAKFSFASTAQLTNQIENSAPFDVIAAADSEHVQELNRKGLLATGSEAIYATGVLALWLPKTGVSLDNLEGLTRADIRVIACAKPELAPYGRAAVDSLHALHIWDQVQLKIVYAENISMAKQYGSSGNADAVFTAYSLVLHESGKVIQVPENLHSSLTQELGILKASQHPEAARKFTEFLLKGSGRAILAQYGYRLPPAR